MKTRLLQMLDELPLIYAVLIAATLGLAPFTPEPHIVEKLRMLVAGNLVKSIDIFDLAMHGLPWLLLGAKLARMTRKTAE